MVGPTFLHAMHFASLLNTSGCMGQVDELYLEGHHEYHCRTHWAHLHSSDQRYSWCWLSGAFTRLQVRDDALPRLAPVSCFTCKS